MMKNFSGGLIGRKILRTNMFRKWMMFCLAWMSLSSAQGQSLTLVESDDAITIKDDEKVVLVYNKVSPPAPEGVDPVYERSGVLHPVNSPSGFSVTEMFPSDHLHQHGVFSAWVRTTYDGKTIDFWNLAGRTGRVLHERIVDTFDERNSVGFEADLIHRMESTPPVDVLRERWRISANATDGSYRSFDLQTTQTAITDKPLLINEYHYGGIALRGPTRWLTNRNKDDGQSDKQASHFLNSLGSDRVQGNHQKVKWVALSGPTEDGTACVAVLSHSRNFRAPQAARLHPTKPYFCFAPCVDGEFVLDRAHPYKARFRYLITDSKPNPEWLNEQWKLWCEKELKHP